MPTMRQRHWSTVRAIVFLTLFCVGTTQTTFAAMMFGFDCLTTDFQRLTWGFTLAVSPITACLAVWGWRKERRLRRQWEVEYREAHSRV